MRPRAYIRLHQPFYDMKSLPSSSRGHSEDEKLKPDGVRGRWWHETLRALATVGELPTAVVQCAAWYGPGAWDSEVVPRLVAGHCYAFLKEDMKFLYK